MLPKVAILVGGLSTRLYPVTKTIPKSLVEVDGKPFIDYQLRMLAAKGIKSVVLCVGYLGEMIEEYIKDGEKYNLQVDYSFDGEKLLGTGGALKKALPKLSDDFFVMYGDSFIEPEFDKIYQHYLNVGKKAIVVVYKNFDRWDKSNIIYKNGIILEYDKKNKLPEMDYIDWGLSLLNKKHFESIEEGKETDLSEILKSLADKKELYGYEVFERFYEIGSFNGLNEVRKKIGEGK